MNGYSNRNFTLGQEDDQLTLRLRTPYTGKNGTKTQPKLGKLPTDRPTHVVVTYRSDKLITYFDGEKVHETGRVQGGFHNWEQQKLLIGDEYKTGRDWAGRVEHVAVFARALSADEASERYAKAQAAMEKREPVRTVELKAKLIARSEIPTLKEISPYRRALVVCEYEPIDLPPNAKLPDRIRVAHWAMLDGDHQSIANAQIGRRMKLSLQRFDANPQLESVYLSDTLEENLDATLFFHTDP